jgi:hypothetical protein
MTTTSPTPATTQQTYPRRTAWRTAVQSALGTLVTLGLVLPVAVATVGDQLSAYIPPDWIGWLMGAAAFVAALSATVARIMAIPAVDAWLRRLGLSSAPTVQ